MIYNILAISDIHWGVIDHNIIESELELFIRFLIEYDDNDKIHLVVICGDYFDSKLLMNSKSAIKSIEWMNRLYNICKERNIKIRIIKGTKEHDNDQLDVFDHLDDNDTFRIFRENYLERDVLPGLNAIFCPDENINSEEYYIKYANNILTEDPIHIGFFHGSFDVVLPDIVVQLSEESSAKSIIYYYDYWVNIIHGPMISGHFHDSQEIEHLKYLGSNTRWAFNEENDKGFGFIRYNTDTEKYQYNHIKNIYTSVYKTFTLNTLLYNNIDDYNNFIKVIDRYMEDNPNDYVRIHIFLEDDRKETLDFINNLKFYYINKKKLKITVKDNLKKQKKNTEKEKHNKLKSEYDFILNKKASVSEILQNYIFKILNVEIPIDFIDKYVNKALNK